MSADPSDRHPPIPYPIDFGLAVRPEHVDVSKCDHEFGVCFCVHDWRIHWGNLDRSGL
ncbi:hypothetical protein PBI_ACHEBE_18 [Mycobacterium phage Achebe]|uniref:Head-to-tail connector protein n=1 Tax=Mycobacterium phage Backyardigan TaxID=2902881 RepID=G1BKZ1_9CAUD|nr:head-tail connector protein [Mycobacterium phage Wile]YP_009635431.1 head-tail connector protein [Mycobacterium phage Backyardigan]AOT27527.1 hypothetical protein SEA_BADGER_18 [Mycobacterium phage Badger]APD17368.1 hypothetical protein PBI_ACHEBE_18 [Mycobacterium phage Achebe]QAY06927.1 hypothetical protein SEA_DATWAY_18 [Mycobacterium phage Datway]QCW22668.1 hypothetical protein SEA_XENA_18 [Mycobacterium phage Xena]AEJ94505.1 hypothetical protein BACKYARDIGAN_18 [Mycobacterium phage Ba